MLGKIKKILIMFILFIPYLSFSNILENISYKNYEIAITFSDNVPKYNEKFDKISPSINFNFFNTIKSKKVKQVIDLKNEYILDILSENYKNQTDVVIYLNPETTYTVYTIGRELRIKFKDQNILETKKKYTIILDAGHGGKDTGAIGHKGYYEKDLAFSTVMHLYNELKDDYNVILTRDKDEFITLSKRAQIGNDINADLFVSIHLNSGGKNKEANGSEVFYYSRNPSKYARQIAKYENDFDKEGTRAIEASKFIISDVIYGMNQKQSAILSNSVLNNIVSTMNTRRRRSTGANFAVLRGSKSSSILIELGFITNVKDFEKFVSKEGQIKVAKAIADAIRKHY